MGSKFIKMFLDYMPRKFTVQEDVAVFSFQKYKIWDLWKLPSILNEMWVAT